MANDTTVRAPYNFVPFSGKILEYKENIPAHDAVDPDLKTGEIHVTLTADTPVFVSDGNKKNPDFFKGPDGRYVLPGSTIRGMIRANMQILGFGLLRSGEDIEDQRVFFRKIADARKSTGGELKTYYHTALGVKIWKTASGGSYSIPEAVRAGYLRKTDSGYEIQPVKGVYARVSKALLEPKGLEKLYATTVKVRYTADRDRVTAIRRDDGCAPGQPGVLLCPGVDTGGDGSRIDKRTGKAKPSSHRYVFPPPDEEAVPIPISKEDELSYAADWESRKNSLRGGTQIRGEKVPYDPDFWNLPEAGQEKPVFYIQHNGHTFFGMSLFLRIGYSHSLKEGLPNHHRELEHNEDFLDWPRAILGWAGTTSSRRSRVSFGDFRAQGDPEKLQPMEPVKTVLGNPKISYYPGYVVEGEHYNQDGFQLRGYKQYWLKEAQATEADKENVASQLRPLPAGTKFSGVIRYRNLRPEELGLLLWAIRLEEGCYQSVGMGKPYGYGRMKVSIDSLREYDMAALYRPEGLCSGSSPAGSEAVKAAVQGYIDKYDAAAAKGLNLKKPKKKPSITSREEIQDFFFLRRTIRNGDEVSYMTLGEYQNVDNALPDTASFRQEAEQAGQGPSVPTAQADQSLEAMKAMLAQRFNRI